MKFKKIVAYVTLSLLALGLGLCVAQAQFVNSYRGFGTGNVSASTLTSSHVYNGTKDMWVYTPPGYADNTDNYPVAIFYGGDGTRGTNIDLFKNTGEGVIDYINLGDKPPGIIICAPQIPSGDYAVAAQFTDVMTYMTTNYRVNSNRVYVTGLSRGGFMCRLLMATAPTNVTAFLSFAGTTNTITWSSLTDKGVWLHHGTADATVAPSEFTAMSNANVSTLDMNISVLTTFYYSVDHTATVWNTNGYNRRDRTDATGTAVYDWVKWVKKFSLDQTERASLHVNYAESESTIEDYRLALIQVNALSAGSTKTALLDRLTTLKSSLDGSGGKRYLIDHGTSTQTTSGNINNMTAHTAGASISSLVDDAGGSSSIGFQIVNQFASSAREGNLTSDCVRGQYFGLDRQTYRDGMLLSTTITTGSCKFTGLNNAKTYDVRFYVSRASSTLTNNSQMTITVAGLSPGQFCNLNTTRYIEFKNVSPVSAEISIIADMASGNDNGYIVAMELYQHP